MVSREEFKELLEYARAGGKVTEGELNLIFDILDQSGDGVLQRSEFKVFREQAEGNKED